MSGKQRLELTWIGKGKPWSPQASRGRLKRFRQRRNCCAEAGDKLAVQRQIEVLEAQRNQKRRSLFEAQDRIDAQRDAMIANIEGRLQQSVNLTRLFLLRWCLA